MVLPSQYCSPLVIELLSLVEFDIEDIPPPPREDRKIAGSSNASVGQTLSFCRYMFQSNGAEHILIYGIPPVNLQQIPCY